MNIRIMTLTISCLRIFPNFRGFWNVGNNFTEFLIHIYFHMRANPWQNLQDGNFGNEWGGRRAWKNVHKSHCVGQWLHFFSHLKTTGLHGHWDQLILCTLRKHGTTNLIQTCILPALTYYMCLLLFLTRFWSYDCMHCYSFFLLRFVLFYLFSVSWFLSGLHTGGSHKRPCGLHS